MPEPPLVSIVIACYNAAPYLGAALRSCLDQDHPRVEIIVVDDGSTDGSLGIARSFEPRVLVIESPHVGHNAARNLGYALSRGEFVQFFDADDVLVRDKLSASLRSFEADASLDVVFTQICSPWTHTFDENIPVPDLPVPRQFGTMGDPYPFHPGIRIPHLNTSQPLYRRRVLERYGTWDPSLPVYDDLELNFRLFVSGARYGYLHRIGVVYRNRPSPERVSYREHAAHPAALPALTRVVETAIRTGWAEGVLRSYLLGVLWNCARDCLSSGRVAQAREYLEIAGRLDPSCTGSRPLRAAVRVLGPVLTLSLVAAPRFLARTVRCVVRRTTHEQIFFEDIAPPRLHRRRGRSQRRRHAE